MAHEFQTDTLQKMKRMADGATKEVMAVAALRKEKDKTEDILSKKTNP
jgi:hypothetical protein